MENHIIGFINQKGGVGKTTCCALIATYLHHNHSNIIVVDTDKPQFSMNQLRTDDIGDIEENEVYSELFDGLEKDPFEILTVSLTDLTSEVIELILEDAGEPTNVLIDLAGTMNQPNYLDVIKLMDVAILPMAPNKLEYEPTLQTINLIIQLNPKCKILFLFNKIKSNEKKTNLEIYKGVLTELFSDIPNFRILDSTLVDLVKFKREPITLVPSKSLKSVVNEILEII